MSMRAAKNRVYSANGVGSGGEPFPEVPLLWLLISARAKAGSKYNLSTDSHWAIGGGHPFKGRRVSEFASISESFESRMVKSRHSSANFMKSSWSEILKVLGATYSLPAAAGLSQAIPARPGSLEVSCRIDNLMGMSGRYSNLDDKRNAAAKRVLLPVLQRAIDREFEGKMREAARRGLLEDVGLLRSLGVVVS